MENKKLTVDFIKAKGFQLDSTTHEDELGFYYEEYSHPSYGRDLVVFFNYFINGSITYDVESSMGELQNVGTDELEVLLRVIVKDK
ncbi:MAG: hypothetical protein PHW82_00475 [Bacteroidales bacterium]|nr:hypothetical protein [Bacteroidales bacterium]